MLCQAPISQILRKSQCGRFDLVVMIRALDLDADSKLISKIRNVDGVTATETLIAMTFE
jgi:DNA-binding Lrp family transcriptional regulator